VATTADIRQPLGKLLVDRGMMTEEELASALDEQSRSGRRLGEILVERRVISGPALANAIASQYGRIVKTEYGYGTGLKPVAPKTVGERLREAEARLTARESELAALRAELGTATRATAAEIAELRRTLDARESDLRAVEEQARLRKLRIDELVAVLDALSAELAALRPRAGEDPTRGHVLFVPAGPGYAVVPGDGPAPAVGSRLELGGCALVVSKLGRSPLPGDRRPCAYLQRV
jgi:type IV pilus assembly protein PilB